MVYGEFKVSTKTANVLLDAILDVLKQLNMNPSRIKGQCYDGESNLSGELNGLQKTLRKAGSKHAIYVHCQAHRLNLKFLSYRKKNVELQRVIRNIDCSGQFGILDCTFQAYFRVVHHTNLEPQSYRDQTSVRISCVLPSENQSSKKSKNARIDAKGEFCTELISKCQFIMIQYRNHLILH